MYIIHCPALKGCWSQGNTIEEALEKIKEAIVRYLITLNEREMYSVKNTDRTIIKEVVVVVLLTYIVFILPEVSTVRVLKVYSVTL